MFVVEAQDFANYLLRAFLLGVLLALFYLLYGFVRVAFQKTPRFKKVFFILQALTDLAYCLLGAFLNILMIFSANRGQIRIIALLFEMAGFLLLYLPAGALVRRMQEKMLRFFRRRVLVPLLRTLGRKLTAALSRIRLGMRFLKLKSQSKQFDKLYLEKIRKELQKGRAFLFPEEQQKEHTERKRR